MPGIQFDGPTVSYQQLDWLEVATIPEGHGLPVQFPLDPSRFSMPNGRSGDLLIIQIKTDQDETAKRQASLRSLGLRGIRSSSIRSSFEENIFGYIRAVRDLIAVARLHAVVYKTASLPMQDMNVEFERIEYGTNTQPGGLIRSSLGDYFAFESDRRGLLANWSTDLTAAECLEELRGAFPSLKPLRGEETSVIGVIANGLVADEVALADIEVDMVENGLDDEQTLDPSSLIIDLPTRDAIEVVMNQHSSLIVARLGFVGLEMMWHRPYARFIDSELERAEVGIYTRDFGHLAGISAFARGTNSTGFFDAVPITAQIRERGVAKHIQI